MQFAALHKSRFRALKTNTCEFPLCDVQIYKPEHYCLEHERLFTKLHAEHQAVLLLVRGVTSENIVQYWQLSENVKHAIRVDTQKRSK